MSKVMKPPYDSLQVANAILQFAQDRGAGISPMKLQKLLYYAHGWHLAIRNKALISEPIQAWDYGPVIESVYHYFKHFGRGRIDEMASSFSEDMQTTEPRIPAEDELTLGLLRKVWDVYGGYSAFQLSNLTHKAGAPWDAARKKHSTFIQDDVIRNYFVHLGERNAEKKQV